MRISGKTQVVGLFGYPVEHSLSPAMHNAAFEHLNMDFCYVTFSVKPELLRNAVDSIRALNLRGVNVTVPHKEKVIDFLEEVDEEAQFIGAVNTIRNSGGVLRGYNTDGRGFMESMSEAGISVSGRKVLIIGAGGACRAVSFYLSAEAKSLIIFDVDSGRAARLAHDLGKIRSNVSTISSLDALDGIDILINATPIGLKESDSPPVDLSLVKGSMTVCDLIYKETLLLRAAAEKGCRTLNGLGMLLHQGVLAFEIWTGVRPPVDIMRKAISAK